jgi:Protein of unknown function (DUF2911)
MHGRSVFNLSLALLLPLAADAQIRGSERGEISQVVNGTKISIDYGRPHVRGRTIFGGQIEWGHMWTPGANQATTVEFSKDVTFVGEPVAAGKYSIWMVPREDADWEVILDTNADLYHTQPPERNDGQIVVAVTPEVVPHRESLTFDFALVEPSGTDLEFRWETTALALRIDVEGTEIRTITEEEAALYAGVYAMELPPEMASEGAPRTRGFTIRLVEGSLRSFVPGPPGRPPIEMMFIPLSEHVFQVGLVQDGRVFEVEQEMYFEFLVEDGAVTGLEVRGLEDELIMVAERVN